MSTLMTLPCRNNFFHLIKTFSLLSFSGICSSWLRTTPSKIATALRRARPLTQKSSRTTRKETRCICRWTRARLVKRCVDGYLCCCQLLCLFLGSFKVFQIINKGQVPNDTSLWNRLIIVTVTNTGTRALIYLIKVTTFECRKRRGKKFLERHTA